MWQVHSWVMDGKDYFLFQGSMFSNVVLGALCALEFELFFYVVFQSCFLYPFFNSGLESIKCWFGFFGFVRVLFFASEFPKQCRSKKIVSGSAYQYIFT